MNNRRSLQQLYTTAPNDPLASTTLTKPGRTFTQALHPKWHPTPHLDHYLSKVVIYIGNRM